VHYFFINEWIAAGEITLKHCPATNIMTDHFTKPLQGTLCRKFRAEIRGISIDMCDADLGWDRPCIKSEQKEVATMNFQKILDYQRSMYLIKMHHNYMVQNRLKGHDIELLQALFK
jgi:hypothetical protein